VPGAKTPTGCFQTGSMNERQIGPHANKMLSARKLATNRKNTPENPPNPGACVLDGVVGPEQRIAIC